MPVLAITPGDPQGVGPEIVWKSLRSPAVARRWKGCHLLCIGAREPFERLGAPVIEAGTRADGSIELSPPRRSKPFIWLLPAPRRAPAGRFLAGYQSGWAIEAAARLVQSGAAQALVTGPISKERLQRGGFPFVGHTDFLAALCAVEEPAGAAQAGSGEPEGVTMMLANDQLRVSLVTTHIALKEVPKALSFEKIRRAVIQTRDYLQRDCAIPRPRIGVAALNPHAGEGGILGREEIEIIAPALATLRRAARGRYSLEGPLPADTLFANHIMAKPRERFDAVVCMYHDQGLIPVKLLDFPRTVNVTLGLPIVRTSVDHGTAFDIAGQGIADPSSFQSAVDLAIRIVRNRRGTSR